MEEYAPTMREQANSLALAHHNILVNDARPIDVIFINVRIMEPVLLLLLTAFQHPNVYVPESMVDQLVA